MNIQRMTLLAEALERPATLPVRFNMLFFISAPTGRDRLDNRPVNFTIRELRTTPKCGTSACAGGLACIMFGDVDEPMLPSGPLARRLLDLTEEQSDQLFFNRNEYVSAKDLWTDITEAEAALAVRRMIATEHERVTA